MAGEDSILNSTKKILGLSETYDAFDLDILTHINTCFFTLNQLGIGPAEGFMIEGPDDLWDDFTQGAIGLNAIKTYVYLRVRLLFDPPTTSYHITAIEEQIKELEYRLHTERELTRWGSPAVEPTLP